MVSDWTTDILYAKEEQDENKVMKLMSYYVDKVHEVASQMIKSSQVHPAI